MLSLDQIAAVDRSHSIFDENIDFLPQDISNESAAFKASKLKAQLADRTNGRLPLHMAAIRNSSISIVSALLLVYPEAVKVVDAFGRLPLHYAVEDSGSDEIIIALLNENPDAAVVADKTGRLPLHLAIAKSRSDTVISALLDAHPKAAMAIDGDGRLPLHDAACHISSDSVISLLLASHPQAVSVADSSSQLPLHEAAGHNTTAVVTAILAAYPDAARIANASGSLPLHEAARCNKNPEVCAALLGVFPEACQVKDNNGRSPLHLAVAFNQSNDVFSCLLRSFPDACKLTDDHGRHPLHDAAARPIENPFIVMQLLNSHPSAASVADRSGVLPLTLAARHCTTDTVINALLAIHHDAAKIPNKIGQLPLHVAAGFSKTTSVVTSLLSAHPDSIKHADMFGRLPLHEAARHCERPEITRAIFLAYPDAGKISDADGCLPIHLAVSINQRSVVAIELLACCPEAAKVPDHSGRLSLELAKSIDAKLIAALLSAYPDSFNSVSRDLQENICTQLSLLDDLVQVILQISDHPLYSSLFISAILFDFQKEQRAFNVQLANGADEQSANLEQFACAMTRSISSQHMQCGVKEFDACLRFAVDRNLKFFVGEAACTMRITKLWSEGYNNDHWIVQYLFYFFLNAFIHMHSKYPPPRVRFYMNRTSYFVFLCAIVTLPIIHTPGQTISNPGAEAFLLYWLACIIYSEAQAIAHFIKDRRYSLSLGLKKYYDDPWSLYDTISFTIAAVAALARILLYFDAAVMLGPAVARQLYAWALALLWGRLVNILAAVPFIGPLLIMVFRMVFKDLFRFAIMAVLIEMPFVIALYYLENGNTTATNDFNTLFKSAASFFRISIAQGPALQDLTGSSWALFATGSVLLGVLLLNLLIAMFSKTFDIIVENSTQEFLLQKAALTFFWSRAPRMPPPMSIYISLRDALMRKLGSTVCTSPTFGKLFTASYQEKSVVIFEFHKKAFQKIFPVNKGTQKYKVWIGKVLDDLEQNGQFNSEAHMNEFKSRMLKGMHKLNRVESLHARIDATQQHIHEGSSNLDHQMISNSSTIDPKIDSQAQLAQDSGLPDPGDEKPSAAVVMSDPQKRFHGEGQKLDKQINQIIGQLADQKLQSSNQLDLFQQKIFLILSAQKQLQEASQRQDKALEAAFQATERRLDAIQKQTGEKLNELQSLLQRFQAK